MASETIVAAAAGIIGVIVGGAITYLIEYQEIKKDYHQKRQELYSRLTGYKQFILQIYASYLATYMRYQYFDCKCELLDKQLSKCDVNSDKTKLQEEYKRRLDQYHVASDKSDDLAIKLAESNKEFWSIIGLIIASFQYTDELKKLINIIKDEQAAIDQFQSSTTELTDSIKSNIRDGVINRDDQIDELWTKKGEELASLVDDTKNLGLKIENLLVYLKENID